MKAKELIKVLSAADPDTEVYFQIGDLLNWKYREMCAKAELAENNCLECLRADSVKIAMSEDSDDGELYVDVILKQYNYEDMGYIVEEFNKMYQLTDYGKEKLINE